MKENINENDLLNFYLACDELIEGKFILSDIKIKNIVNEFNNNKCLTDMLMPYEFEYEFEASKLNSMTNGSYLKMPVNYNELINYVYSFLNTVNNGNLNLQKFVDKYFYSPSGYLVSYNNFAITMLKPFKEAIMSNIYSKNNNELKKEQADSLSDESKLQNKESKVDMKFASLINALSELVNAIKVNNKLKIHQKEELLIVANSMIDSIKREDLKTISALVIAFEYALSNNKQIRYYYNSFLRELSDLLF